MKRMGVWLVLIVFGVAVTGCATSTQPGYYAYPKPGQTVEQFNRDQYECQAWARQQSGYDPSGAETAKGAGVGAVLGALGGAAAGAAIGAATGGIGGAVIGGGHTYAQGKDGYDRAYAACMTARGYVVR